MSLYLKYRPDNFDSMVGNAKTIAALKGLIADENRPHVLLFSGPAGTGKTTAARILAKMLGASDIDTIELNTASNRGIDTARDIIEMTKRTPIFGSIMAFILDECHRWTIDFMNAMLKILEDTPEHCYFFLCTTEPNRLIAPLLSRCTEFKFSELTGEEILKLLRRINRLENIEADPEILEKIADLSGGCPRKSLVLLEKVSYIRENGDRLKFITTDIDDEAEIIGLCRALMDNRSQWKDIAKILKKLDAGGKLSDPETVRHIAMGYFNAVLLNGNASERAMKALDAFCENMYNSGKYGITLACLNTII